MKKSYIIGSIVIIACIALGAAGFKSMLVPYVTVSEAIKSDSVVPVKGALDKHSIGFDKLGRLNFNIRGEDGREMKVIYAGSKPGNLEQASHVVAVGTYRKAAFHAEKLIVKCPSKYQGETKGSN